MARPSKNKHTDLKQIFPRDKEFFGNIKNCGVVTTQHLKDAGITKSRMKEYIKCGYMQKTKPENGGKFGYVATPRGKDFAEKTWGYERKDFYTFQSLEHCGKLAEEYFQTDHSRYEWRTESQAREMFQDKIEQIREEDPGRAEKIEQLWEKGDISMPDALVIERGTERILAVEVITNSYGQQELQQKELFVEIMQVEYKPIRA
ncbi:hypothetical protein [Paraclostridium sordellii]|uniref:hypothetical protein n=1 Tax=Paraclostridium sordellii TaxID=1505 RepID=UPI0005E16580|nr:hypothetical protein [Paeniclostridium sordellii]CEP82664.1 Uncharacterised protein [[Clostridium] sordellii] [Paeniclostridium sordellii]